MEILGLITEPLQYSFMVKAVVVSAVVGATCALLSCFLILKGWSLLGDAISHAVLPGVVVAYIIGIPFSIGACFFALLSVVMIGFVKTKTKIKEDAIMGIVFTTFFAFGLILISRVVSSVDLTHVLFGEVLGISDSSAFFTIATLLVVAVVILLFRKMFTIFCFDVAHAESVGLPVKVIHYSFLILLALTITGSLQTVGIILVIAMLITPGSTGFLLTKRFPTMMIIAVAVSVFSSVVGAYGSYYLDISTGGAIVFTQGCIFSAVFIYKTITAEKSKRKRMLSM